MELVQFAEEILGLKLYSYQKFILKRLERADKIYYPCVMRDIDKINYEWAKGTRGLRSKMTIYEDYMGRKKGDNE